MYTYLTVVDGLVVLLGNSLKEAIDGASALVGGRQRLSPKKGARRVLVVKGPLGEVEVALAGRDMPESFRPFEEAEAKA